MHRFNIFFWSFTCSLSMNGFMHRFNLFLGNVAYSSSLTGITLTFLQVLKHTHVFKKYNAGMKPNCLSNQQMISHRWDVWRLYFVQVRRLNANEGFGDFVEQVCLPTAYTQDEIHTQLMRELLTLDLMAFAKKDLRLRGYLRSRKKCLKVFLGSPGRSAMPSKGYVFS